MNPGVADRRVLRLGGACAMIGGALTLAGNMLHPREPGQLDSAANLFAVVQHSDRWVVVHVLLTIAILFLMQGMYALTRSITEPRAVPLARFAWNVAILGIGSGLALMITEATAMRSAVSAWASSSGAARDLALAAGTPIFDLSLTFSVGGMFLLFGIPPLLYGAAILVSRHYPRWLGYWGMGFGLVNLTAAGIQLLTGKTSLTFFVLFPIGAVGIVVWIVALGVFLWRQSAADPAPSVG